MLNNSPLYGCTKRYQKEYCALYRIDPLIIKYSSISHTVFLTVKNLLSDTEVATSTLFLNFHSMSFPLFTFNISI